MLLLRAPTATATLQITTVTITHTVNDSGNNNKPGLVQQEQEQQQQQPLCCCIVKWKSTDIVAEKFPFVQTQRVREREREGERAQWKSWSRKVKRALALKWKKNSNRQQAACCSSQQWQQCTWDKPVIILYTLNENLLCIYIARAPHRERAQRYANWTATTEAI